MTIQERDEDDRVFLAKMKNLADTNFADEAVRNCNTNPRTGRKRGVPRIDIQSAAINETKGNQ